MPLPSDSVLHDQAYFEALLGRVLDPDWVEPKQATPGSGYELIQALAAVGARVSTAIEQFERAALILYASDLGFASGTVQLGRTADGGSPYISVSAGAIVLASASGRRFVTLDAANFAPGSAVPTVLDTRVIALEPGQQYNLSGTSVSARGEAIAGEIDTIWRATEVDSSANPAFDPTIRVSQRDALTGGNDNDLGLLGLDEGVPRAAGENAAHYSYRLRNLPDVVSPAAIQRTAGALLDPYGQVGVFEETTLYPFCGCFDDTSASAPLMFDDPRPDNPAFPFAGRFADPLTDRGCFVIVVQRLRPVAEVGMMYDDPGHTSADFGSGYGLRALPAFDMPANDPTVLAGLAIEGCFDGYDAAAAGVYVGLYDALQATKAGGVTAILAIRG